MRGALYALVAALVLGLASALVIIQRVESQTEHVSIDDIQVQEGGETITSWPRVVTAPVFSEARAQTILDPTVIKPMNIGAVVDLFVKQGALTESAHGLLERGADGSWVLPSDLNHQFLSGLGLKALEMGDEDGAAILDEFSSSDPLANAAALAKLALWIDPVTEDPLSSVIPNKRREILAEKADFSRLPETIEVSGVVFYSGQGRQLDLGEVPSEVLSRVVFRDCLFYAIGFNTQGPARLRFERCLLMQGTNFVSHERSEVDLTLTDCVVKTVFSFSAGRVRAKNCLISSGGVSTGTNTKVRPEFDWSGSVLVNSRMDELGTGLPNGFKLSTGLWCSDAVRELPDEDLQVLVRIGYLSEQDLADVKAARVTGG